MSSICANSDKIIGDYEAGGNSNSKRTRKHGFEDVDKYLLKWFKCARDQKVPISGEMLLLKGQEFAKKIKEIRTKINYYVYSVDVFMVFAVFFI